MPSGGTTCRRWPRMAVVVVRATSRIVSTTRASLNVQAVGRWLRQANYSDFLEVLILGPRLGIRHNTLRLQRID